MATTEETVEVVPYSFPFGLERVIDPKEGDQAWCDMAIGGIREFRTLTNGVWVPDLEALESGLQLSTSFGHLIK
ncbi:MAG: hypothetical protein AAB470_00085 [Patescibacteria group bacterium]